MPAGRPSTYDPAYCDDVIGYGRAGKSRAWIAAELDISRQTLANWEKTHPEFLDAMDRAGVLSQQWWEDQGQIGLTAEKFSAPVWSRSMAARFPDDWREKSEVQNNHSFSQEAAAWLGLSKNS